MKWIELIRVRSSEATLRAALPTLAEQIRELESSRPDVETLFLQHALYDGDLAVVAIWQTDSPAAKTREGLLVAESLAGLGTVDHAVWIPTSELSNTPRRI
ncbi:MAG: hypothetical protein AAF799_14715 [Myxococcota bacterium]